MQYKQILSEAGKRHVAGNLSDVAQVVERRSRKAEATGSSPVVGSNSSIPTPTGEERESAKIEDQFKAVPEPECSCGNSALLAMNLHDDDCDLRLMYEHNCMITHTYYANGWNDGEAYATRRIAALQQQWNDDFSQISRQLDNAERAYLEVGDERDALKTELAELRKRMEEK